MSPTNQTDYQLILVTCPDESTGITIARHLLDQRKAACVNVIPGLTSLYRWEGLVQEDSEILLLIKSKVQCFDDIQRIVTTHHPYDTPECLALPIQAGSLPYLHWIDDSLA